MKFAFFSWNRDTCEIRSKPKFANLHLSLLQAQGVEVGEVCQQLGSHAGAFRGVRNGLRWVKI